MAYNEPSVVSPFVFYRFFFLMGWRAWIYSNAIAPCSDTCRQRSHSTLWFRAKRYLNWETNVIRNCKRAIWKVYFCVTLSMFFYIAIGTILYYQNYFFSWKIFSMPSTTAMTDNLPEVLVLLMTALRVINLLKWIMLFLCFNASRWFLSMSVLL